MLAGMHRLPASAFDFFGLWYMRLVRDRRPLPAAPAPPGEPTGLAGLAELARESAPSLAGCLGTRTYECRRTAFPSPLRTTHEANNTVHGLLCPPRLPTAADGPRPALLALHGYRQMAYGYAGRLAAWCARRGWVGWALALPYHLARRAPGCRHGEHFISPDLGQFVRATRQAVADTLAAVEALRRAGCPKVAVVGGSLGAWIASLAAVCDPGLDAVVLISPVADPVAISERLPFLRQHRRALRKAGLVREDLERALVGLRPVALRPAVPPERLLVVSGRRDLVVPAEAVEELWRAWGRPARKVYPHGHFSLMLLGRHLFGDIGRFLVARGWPACAAADGPEPWG